MSDRIFVTVQKRGVISLPSEIRRRYRLDEPGAQVEMIEGEDGSIVLMPQLPVPAGQRWFWSEQWQAMEREADEDVAAGRISRFDSPDDFLDDLDSD